MNLATMFLRSCSNTTTRPIDGACHHPQVEHIASSQGGRRGSGARPPAPAIPTLRGSSRLGLLRSPAWMVLRNANLTIMGRGAVGLSP